jgi:FKBP-type peptidyl-prolyl cis-trans isomerase
MNRSSNWIGGALLGVIAMLIGCGGSDQASPAATTSPAPTTQATSDLKIIDQVVGTGDVAEDGDTITVHYTGYLVDGTKFDSSLDRGKPFQITLGMHRVIPGWEQGLRGMKVGGKRQLIIPPDLAYGAAAQGKIPRNSTLNFEIELLAVNK